MDFSRTTNVSESSHSSLNSKFPKKVGPDTAIERLKDYKLKLIKDLAARCPINFFGVAAKPSVQYKRKKKDADRLTAIYHEVHNFSLLDQEVQLETLKEHLISVGSKRRSNFNYRQAEVPEDLTYDDISDSEEP